MMEETSAVDEEDVLIGLLPLMKEYFLGESELREGKIVYALPDGQTFELYARRTSA